MPGTEVDLSSLVFNELTKAQFDALDVKNSNEFYLVTDDNDVIEGPTGATGAPGAAGPTGQTGPTGATGPAWSKTDLINAIYPVGSIYMTTNSANPKTTFGVGTWTQITNRFLIGASSTYAVDGTGGASTVTLTVNQIPSHSHSSPVGVSTSGTTSSAQVTWSGSNLNAAAVNTGSAGGGQSHTNMPPWYAVYIWKRTA